VTALAVDDALAVGSRWTYLGVFEENQVARSLYESLGFRATKPYYDNPIAGSRFLVLALR